MPREDHKAANTKPDEFAPGIPSSRKIRAVPRVARTRPQEWGIATQVHEAKRAGPHTDLRIVDPKGQAHSWAIPGERGLPKPGEKFQVIQQPTHTKEYAERQGTFQIPGGTYGAGKVRASGLAPVEVVSRRPGVLRFNVYSGRSPQELSLIDTPKGQLLYNHTITKETGVRGAGGHPIPQSKPKYKEKRPESIQFDGDDIHQAKIDGAHVTFHLPGGGRQLRAFSYRPTERETGVIEHTHRLPRFRSLTAPPGLAGTVLRGELWAADAKGRALPAERLGGILNASVPRSRELQAQHGQLRAAPFDVLRYKGRDVENAPYEKKLEMLEQIHKQVPFLKPPPTAKTPREKERLFAKIQAGSLKETKEGVVSWPREGGRPTKIKLRPDVDAKVVGVFKGRGKHEGRAGGVLVELPGSDVVTRVGTGFTDKQRQELWDKREEQVGRVAKIETQQIFSSGRLRAPSFKEFHIEKGKQPEKTAALYHGSPRRVGTLKPSGEHGDPRVPQAVFASPDETFALAYAGRKWGDRDISQWTRGGPNARMILREARPGAFQDVYGGKKGYIYEVPEEPFKALKGRRTSKEVVSTQPVRPLRTKVVPDALRALKQRPDVEMHSYDPNAPEMRTDIRRQVKRMKEMDSADAAQYKKWRLEVAPPEVKQMFNEEEKRAAFLGFFDEIEKLAYGIGSHKDLTTQALDNLEEKKGIKLTPAQRGRLLKANAGTDWENVRNLFLSPKTKPFHYHQGEEKVSKGLIKSHMDMAVAAKNTDAALDALGIALHTQQDRWAHSEQRVRSGAIPMLKHTFKRVDNPKVWPQQAQRAVKDTERLVTRFVDKRPKRLGRVTNAPRYFTAKLRGPNDGK